MYSVFSVIRFYPYVYPFAVAVLVIIAASGDSFFDTTLYVVLQKFLCVIDFDNKFTIYRNKKAIILLAHKLHIIGKVKEKFLAYLLAVDAKARIVHRKATNSENINDINVHERLIGFSLHIITPSVFYLLSCP